MVPPCLPPHALDGIRLHRVPADPLQSRQELDLVEVDTTCTSSVVDCVEVGRDSTRFDETGKESAKLCRSCDALELDST
jgi:hypothetical protein